MARPAGSACGAGQNGLFYGKVGYQWVNFDKFGDE